jgi:hypothetical protein
MICTVYTASRWGSSRGKFFGRQPPVHGACRAPPSAARRHDDTTIRRQRRSDCNRPRRRRLWLFPLPRPKYQRLSPLAATTVLRTVVDRSEDRADRESLVHRGATRDRCDPHSCPRAKRAAAPAAAVPRSDSKEFRRVVVSSSRPGAKRQRAAGAVDMMAA